MSFRLDFKLFLQGGCVVLLEQALTQLENDFSISQTMLLTIATQFQEHMEQGLTGHVSSLKMFASYLRAPSGNESGTFLALDFGGSNTRVSVVELKGEGIFLESHRVSRPLLDPESGRDYRAADVTAEELFDFIAGIVQEVLNSSSTNPTLNSNSSGPLPLGFAFSFPYRQQKIGEGILLNWNKQVKTSGVVGKDVGQLLSAALTRRRLGNVVRPTAIINDTVANFLTSAYQDPSVDIASVIGTGHNTCYLEQKAPGFNTPIIINCESGNFSAAPETAYDQKLDQQSDNPGKQRFEKMLSGKYLGELFRIVVQDLSQREILGTLNNPPAPARWNQPYSVSGKDLALILNEQDTHSRLLQDDAERSTLKRIAHILTKRSARLVVASLLGVVRHLDPHLEHHHTVAIDGSVYKGTLGYTQELTSALNEALESKASLVTVKKSIGGSLTGAAIAAALVKQIEN